MFVRHLGKCLQVGEENTVKVRHLDEALICWERHSKKLHISEHVFKLAKKIQYKVRYLGDLFLNIFYYAV